MSSEIFICSPDPRLSLAYTLAQAGYDVWLGNSRGNKYSSKHKSFKPSSMEFWDFSLDQIAQIDLPSSVDYILKHTGQPSLSYIAFSQGSAQGFASLSLDHSLNKKINLFIALAPVTKPIGLENRRFNTLVRTSPDLIYLLFGRKCLLSLVIFWQNVIPNGLFAKVIDACLWFIFSWRSLYLPYKDIVYKHLYSYSSVKCVVHWFQIMSSQRFEMYDDNPSFLLMSDGHVTPQYPTENITTPIALFYGGKDTLPDLQFILNNSQEPIFIMEVSEYEHLHFLWGEGLDRIVYPSILGLLSEYNETWSDANSNLHFDDKIKTVPWISRKDILKSMETRKSLVKRSMSELDNNSIKDN